MMAASFVLIIMINFATTEAIYKSLDNDSVRFWASESRKPGDPIHSYSSSKRFCESLAGEMPIGSAEDFKVLNSMLPLGAYPYWLGQGEAAGTWSDGSIIEADYDADHPECESNCGMHYAAGRLVKMSMDEERQANIVCKIVMDYSFFLRLMTSKKLLLSSDQHEVVLAAQFARSFLTAGFYMGVSFISILLIVCCAIFFTVSHCIGILMSRKWERVAKQDESDEIKPFATKTTPSLTLYRINDD